MFEKYPYTNLQDLNLDWILRQMRALQRKVDQMDVDGKNVFVDVSTFIDGELTSANIVEAINNALAEHRYLYIPAGDYTFNMKINKDCEIILDKECHIHPGKPVVEVYTEGGVEKVSVTKAYCIRFEDCSAKLSGGYIDAGVLSASRDMLYDNYIRSFKPDFSGLKGYGIIEFIRCHDSEISNFICNVSQYPIVVHTRDCVNFTAKNAIVRNVLSSAFAHYWTGQNLVYENLVIENIRCAYKDYYCYGIVLSTYNLSDTTNIFTPPDNVIIRNCLVKNSEDSGIDSHGSTNTLIENNEVMETVCAITCYNDCRRVQRPAGWTMTGTVIRNNKCISSKTGEFVDPDDGTTHVYHPFCFVGSANMRGYYEHVTEGDEGTFFDFNGAIIDGNYFMSNNKYGRLISFNACSRGIRFTNNYVNVLQAGVIPFNLTRCINFVVQGNTFEGFNTAVQAKQAYGVIQGNTGGYFGYDSDFASYWEGQYGRNYGEFTPRMVKYGDVVRSADRQLITSSTYGLTFARAAFIPANLVNVQLTVQDGIGTCEHNRFIPDMVLTMVNNDTSETVTGVVLDCIDFETITINGSDRSTPVPDGTYTVNPVVANMTFTDYTCKLQKIQDANTAVKDDSSAAATTIDTLAADTIVIDNTAIRDSQSGYHFVTYVKSGSIACGWVYYTHIVDI